ncbi:helix-turn-helix transcriptional regulator [Methylobacterium sp. E-016]|uniref:helix-turn-helix transcriptional regulator n=1 Tax=Methylobacterium sp. E-016 TaxID=2836556 RepID=UPI001FBB1B65|nr:helix-turn-helix transcriptional regulator [Methylobacterium sp. E-016]
MLAINAEAERILQNAFSRTVPELVTEPESGRSTIKRLLALGRARIQLQSENWILVERAELRPLIMHAVPLANPDEHGPHTVLILIDLDATPQPNQVTLERIFGLTPAEARLAGLLASGVTTAEVAQLQGVRVATVRSQLAAIFSKTRTHRQAELVTLVARLSILP